MVEYNEFEQRMFDTFPQFFKYKDDITTSRMWEGFMCSEGWYPLIETLLQLAKNHGETLEVLQIKEKYGTLRFYTDGASEFFRGAARMAFMLSMKTCEACGAPAKHNNHRVICNRCREKWKLELL